MKRHIALIALVSIALTQAAAFEYGGIIDNNITGRVTANNWIDPRLSDTATVTVNMRQPFNKDGTVYIAAEGFFRYDLGVTLIPLTFAHNFTTDLSLFKVGANIRLNNNKSLSFSVGRFWAADDTGLIFNQTLDGLWFQFNASRAVIQVAGGYTGLLNAKTTSMLTSTGTNWSFDRSQPFYILAAPYIIGNAKVEFPYLFANQTLTVEALGAFGIDIAQTDGNRMYATLALNGPLAPVLFYELSSTVSVHDFDFSALSNLSRLEFTVYPHGNSMKLKFGATYASGTIPDVFSPFAAITAQPAVSLAGKGYSGILKTGLSFSVKANNKFLLVLGGDALFDCKTDFAFSGVQAAMDMRFQFFSDLALDLDAKSYFAMEEAKNATSVSLKLTISF
ncbi:MAG: hypothetical protein IIT68_08975 [Treponema sp.]|nr:hypothetical protein [Treponema sp.]